MSSRDIEGENLLYLPQAKIYDRACALGPWIVVGVKEPEVRRWTIGVTIKRGGKVWIRIFPDKPLTKKPLETRMGKGKGAPEQWVCVVRPGRIMFEMEGVTEVDARRAMQLAAAKLPIKTKVVARLGDTSHLGGE